MDAVVRGPLVERGAHFRCVRRRDRRRRGRRADRRRQTQRSADEQRVRRVDAVQVRERCERRMRASRDRSQRVAGLDDIAFHLGLRDAKRDTHRNARLQAERGERRRPCDAVGADVHQPLIALDSGDGRLVHVRVHRHAHAVLVEEVLQHGDVPAEAAAHERARTKERRSERAELTTRAHVCDARHRQLVDALERTHRSQRVRADDRVDRAQIEALRAQGDLEPCMLRVRCARGCGCRQACRERSRAYEPEAHRRAKYRAGAGIPPTPASEFTKAAVGCLSSSANRI